MTQDEILENSSHVELKDSDAAWVQYQQAISQSR